MLPLRWRRRPWPRLLAFIHNLLGSGLTPQWVKFWARGSHQPAPEEVGSVQLLQFVCWALVHVPGAVVAAGRAVGPEYGPLEHTSMWLAMVYAGSSGDVVSPGTGGGGTEPGAIQRHRPAPPQPLEGGRPLVRSATTGERALRTVARRAALQASCGEELACGMGPAAEEPMRLRRFLVQLVSGDEPAACST